MAADTSRFSTGEHLGLVAGLTFLIVVFAEQRECGQIMIEPRCFFPGRLRVTVLALVTLLALVHFIFKMARGTGGAWRCIEYWFNVTIDAVNRFMRTVQHEFGVPVMLEASRRPLVIGMASSTVGAVVAVVVVILEVATDTSHVHFVGKRIFAVTVVASQLSVAA